MASLDMKGAFQLTLDEINEKVTEVMAGNYALGYVKIKNGKRVFIVQYVGRSDTDVARRLKEHVGEGYSHFKFSYASSRRAAFIKECQNYHDFNPSDNNIHPRRPDDANWRCPNPDCDELD